MVTKEILSKWKFTALGDHLNSHWNKFDGNKVKAIKDFIDLKTDDTKYIFLYGDTTAGNILISRLMLEGLIEIEKKAIRVLSGELSEFVLMDKIDLILIDKIKPDLWNEYSNKVFYDATSSLDGKANCIIMNFEDPFETSKTPNHLLSLQKYGLNVNMLKIGVR